jgi:hypothetical protein
MDSWKVWGSTLENRLGLHKDGHFLDHRFKDGKDWTLKENRMMTKGNNRFKKDTVTGTCSMLAK